MHEAESRNLTRRDALRLSLGGALAAAGTVVNTDIVAAGAAENAASGKENAPPVRTRSFWTWDHSTEWMLRRPGAQTLGASNYYARTRDAFEGDYTRLLRYCGQHQIDAVVVWGLLRDAHGGLESAKRLCDVARESGVRLMCGVGLCAYGGVYYQGDSPYSLDRHLKKHPELKAVNDKGEPMEFSVGIYGPKMFYHACPSRRENQEYIAKSVQWLLKNLPLGGIQIESGDNGVCRCTLCRERRQHPAGRFSWEDLALSHPIAIRAARSVNPDAWIFSETYSHPEPHTGEDHPTFGGGRTAWADECLAKIPDGVFIQWVYDRVGQPLAQRPWTRAGDLETGRHRHILRAHFSTYWAGLRGEPAVDEIAGMVRETVAHGADGISIFGEVSPFETGAELNYLALEHFGSAANPQADPELFLRDVAGPLLGGQSHARDFLRYAKLEDQPDKIPGALEDIYKRCGTLPPEAARRWAWLGNLLASLIY